MYCKQSVYMHCAGKISFFPAASLQMHRKLVEMHRKHLSTCSAMARGFFPAAAYQMYCKQFVYMHCAGKIKSLSSGSLANALQASQDALQTFQYMLRAGKLSLSSGFLPDVSQAIRAYALRWQD
jgi:hypothetical protein